MGMQYSMGTDLPLEFRSRERIESIVCQAVFSNRIVADALIAADFNGP